MLRRCLSDYWEGDRWGRKGKRYGGEGCVMIVDAAGAGYKNLVSSDCGLGVDIIAKMLTRDQLRLCPDRDCPASPG